MRKLIDFIPGKGVRTYVAVVLLVIVFLADKVGFGVSSLDTEVVQSVEAVLGGLAIIFLRAGK